MFASVGRGLAPAVICKTKFIPEIYRNWFFDTKKPRKPAWLS